MYLEEKLQKGVSLKGELQDYILNTTTTGDNLKPSQHTWHVNMTYVNIFQS